MIVKNKEISSSKDVRQMAGNMQEQDVAFFLRRAYKDDKQVFVFNDLRFEFNDEIAQIDHLLLYPYGFVLIESKSITGEVKVNNNQEWMRSYKQQWSGMRSPIKQVELQEQLLRELLYANRYQILPKKLFGVLQQGFGGRCWDQICAISSNAIVHRDDMPKDISKKLFKSEFVIDKLTKLMKIPKSKILNALKASDTRPAFSSKTMGNISNFLVKQHKPLSYEKANQVNLEPAATETNQVTENKKNTYTTAIDHVQTIVAKRAVIPEHEIQPMYQKFTCKKCNNTEQLQAASGKFGYYIKCPKCNTNTAMKRNCPSCGSKNTKIHKKKANYYLTCQDCNAQHDVFVQTE